MKFAFQTLGCKLNFSESATLSRQLIGKGLTRVENPAEAEIIIVNTCSVTDHADRKCRQAITRLHRLNPTARIVVTGCYAQLNPTRLSTIEGVKKVISTADKFNIDAYLSEDTISTSDKELTFCGAVSYDERTRCFLKVQDGCDYFCTYCTIPHARGRSRSATVEQTMALAVEAAQKGIKEIVLTGVNIGTFGKGTSENLLSLCQALDNLYDKGIERIRISSIEPNLLTDELIDFTLHSHIFAPHFHIPLQSGSDDILKLMGRRYRRDTFAERVQRIKHNRRDAFIGVDVIVGMRGETEEMFQDSLDFIQSLPVTQLHVFPYSERSGTRALQITPIVPENVKKQRAEKLQKISQTKLTQFYEQHIGCSARVLWEKAKKDGNLMHGFTDNYIRVSTPYNPQLADRTEWVQLGSINLKDRALSLIANRKSDDEI